MRLFVTSAPLALCLAAVACSDPKPAATAADAAVASDADGSRAGAADVPPASADASTDVSATAVCGKSDDSTFGKKKPWSAFTSEGKTFQCNVCRGGYPNIQGAWRFIDFATEDPSTPLKDGYRERLTIDGNTFTNQLEGKDLGKDVTQTIAGWYFCADPNEMSTGDTVFVLESVAPDGAFGNQQGTVFRATVKADAADPANPATIALGMSAGIKGKWIGEFLYCRIGSTLNGKPCSDPFK
ncbi:MAG: hypothetical protein EXR79_16655 [Myxococcales bacterium]|nr:hypothetical protein [Myxococcales bacterium]